MALVGHYVMSEDDRRAMMRLRSKQEAYELFIGGGNAKGDPTYLSRYINILDEVNEFKRKMLMEAEQLDEDMFNYTFYFDTVAGVIWYEDAE